MNIRFKKLTIENFRSIGKASVDLENQGTVIVKGVNEYEENATSNGSGKSSIFEAIIFSLFEETTSGDKDVANRLAKNGYTLVLDFDIDGIEYKILRECTSGGKTSVVLYKDNVDISARNKTDTNKLIISILGMNRNIFLDSVFLSQNVSTNLASLTPTARKERLEILTSTDTTINKFKEYLKEKQINYEALCVENQTVINNLNGRKDSYLKQKQEIEFKINEINEQIKQRDSLGNLEDIDNKIQNLQNNLIHIPEQIKEYEEVLIPQKEQEISSLRKQGEDNVNKQIEWNSKVSDKRTEYNDKLNEIGKFQLQINQITNDNKKLETQIEEIKNSDKCPTCGRKYENSNEEHIQQTIDKYKSEIDSNNTQITNKMKEIDNLNKELDVIENEGKTLKQELENISKFVTENTNNINELERQKTNLNLEKTKLQSEKTIIENNINHFRDLKEQILSFKVGNKTEFEDMLSNIENNLKDIDFKLEQETFVYTKNNDYVSTIKHSIQLVTKEFRTYLLQNSLIFLNNLLKQYSKDLFSNESDIIYIEGNDTKLDIKLGDATYESLSGGEKTRVNIALLLAQKSLASTIGNINCNMIILDEVLGYCDSYAECKVIDLITKELDSLESIYMISHKEIPIAYDSLLTVTKDVSGYSNVRCY